MDQRVASGNRLEAVTDMDAYQSPGPIREGVTWERNKSSDVAVAKVSANKADPILRGNGTYNRIIENVDTPIRFESASISLTLHLGDRLWVPKGEPYLLRPLSGKASFILTMWPIPEEEWLSTFESPHATE